MSSASAIRAGKAMVELGVNRKGFDREIRDVARMWESFGKQVQAIARPFAIASTAALSAAGAAAVAFASFGDNLDEMAQRTGASVEALSALGYGAKLAGTDLETVEGGMRNLGKVVTEAASGSESAAKAIASIGLSASDLTSLRPEQQLRLIADGLSSIENPGARATAAMELLGKSGTKLLPLLQGGASGLDAMQKRAEELGLVMSGGAAKAAAALSDAIDEAKLTIQAMTVAVGAALAPHIRRMIRDIAETVGEITRWIQRNNAAVIAAANFAASIAKIAVPLYAMGKATSFAGEMLKKLQTALESITSLSKSAQQATAALAMNAETMAKSASLAAAANTSMATASASASGSIAAVIARLSTYVAVVHVGVAATALIGAAIQAVGDAYYRYNLVLSDSAKSARESADAQRAQDASLINSLANLARQHKLTSREQGFAASAARELQKKYGDVGITAELTAQQVQLLRLAFEQFGRASRIAELTKELDEVRKNIDEIGKTIEGAIKYTNSFYGMLDLNPFWAPTSGSDQMAAYVDWLNAEQDALRKRQHELLSERKLMQDGGGSLTGGNKPGGAALQEAVDAAKNRAEWARRVHDLQISMIEDEQQREIAAINSKYDYELSQLQQAGADAETLALAEEARQMELEKLRIDMARKVAREEQSLADDIERTRIEGIEDTYERELEMIRRNADIRIREAKAAGLDELVPMIEAVRDVQIRNAQDSEYRRQRDEQAAEEQRSADANDEQRLKIKELEIRTKLKGPEQEIALKQLARENALANAQKAGLDVGLVKRQYDLEMELLRQEISDRVAEIAGRIESVGTFNAYAVAGLGGAGAPDERTARNTEEMLKVLRGMDRRGGLFVN